MIHLTLEQKMLLKNEALISQYRKMPAHGPRTVVIGGGTGLSTILRGLKLFTTNLTAIVTVADNGGSSGMLRQDLGMLPPGDIRNCILALADTEPLMEDLFNHRFQDGRLKGQNFGNLLIAAMDAVSGNFYDAVVNVSKILAVKGRVLPVSLQDLQISARMTDGSIIHGEWEIGQRQPEPDRDIAEIFMTPADAVAFPEAAAALLEADIIILGPGSLYTSIVPNLLFKEIRQALRQSPATKIYVCNLMTQPAETAGYDGARHLKALLQHLGKSNAKGYIDYCVVNSTWTDELQLNRYRQENALPVQADKEAIEALGTRLVLAPLARINNDVIRHDHQQLARVALHLAIEKQKLDQGDK